MQQTIILNTSINSLAPNLHRTKKIACRQFFGGFVTVEVHSARKTYQILGSSETNPASGVISRHSPLGKALLGRRVGEVVAVQLANKLVEYKIIKIE